MSPLLDRGGLIMSYKILPPQVGGAIYLKFLTINPNCHSTEVTTSCIYIQKYAKIHKKDPSEYPCTSYYLTNPRVYLTNERKHAEIHYFYYKSICRIFT